MNPLKCLLFLQGTKMGLAMVNSLRDPELQRLVTNIPFTVVQARAPSSADRYSRAFNEFKRWASKYDEIVSLPTTASAVAHVLIVFVAKRIAIF